MKIIRTFLCLFVTFLFLTSCNQEDKEVKVLKLAHGLPPSHSVHLGLIYLNEQLEELSHGKMKLDIYASGQLGSESQCIELLQIGSLDMTKVSSASLEGFVDPFKVFGIPYIFKSRTHYFSVIDGSIGQQILTTTEPYWFRGLTYFDSGARSFYTNNKPIRTPADLKGLKIRVQRSPIAVEMMRTFGGSATPVDWGELYTALQSNVVDGAENNTPSITTAFHHEVAKYFSVNEHTMCPDVIIISMARWNKLNEQERTWLQQAADKARIYQRQLWEVQEKQSLDEMIERGMEIIYPDKQPFIEASRPMIERFKNDPAFSELIDKIEQTHEKDN
ncbi:TRAP transporter substrate-binding protein [Parabacteroides sp. PF5-9]|uniref:TRAP transporter substrate-binding protein n=1 Tax=Parabacteroides sp. PF5-9 TaxID=1742404 RepID=UPI00247338D6|nr:TRAP transporter substrate-binding protein [Parabacteroides sp. PF5-9]MDH6358601.1 tripartite ATP-independent transporter DctP family solute receptor [Parabacteroides sp. PF5-9]